MGWLEHFDHQLFFLINNGLSTPILDHFFWVVSVLAHGVVLIVIAGMRLWYVDRQQFKPHLGWIVVALLVGTSLTQLIKYQLDRPRPLDEFAALIQAGTVHLNIIGRHLYHRSFPSGHTQGAACVLSYLVMLYPNQWYWYGGGLFLVGLSRVYLGVHFPSDVVAGAIIGGLCGVMAWQAHSYFRPRTGGKEANKGERNSRMG